jgi:hypothetical protein
MCQHLGAEVNSSTILELAQLLDVYDHLYTVKVRMKFCFPAGFEMDSIYENLSMKFSSILLHGRTRKLFKKLPKWIH